MTTRPVKDNRAITVIGKRLRGNNERYKSPPLLRKAKGEGRRIGQKEMETSFSRKPLELTSSKPYLNLASILMSLLSLRTIRALGQSREFKLWSHSKGAVPLTREGRGGGLEAGAAARIPTVRPRPTRIFGSSDSKPPTSCLCIGESSREPYAMHLEAEGRKAQPNQTTRTGQ